MGVRSETPVPYLQGLRGCPVSGWSLADRTHTDNGHLQTEIKPTRLRQVHPWNGVRSPKAYETRALTREGHAEVLERESKRTSNWEELLGSTLQRRSDTVVPKTPSGLLQRSSKVTLQKVCA